jgi:hypothetical protein
VKAAQQKRDQLAAQAAQAAAAAAAEAERVDAERMTAARAAAEAWVDDGQSARDHSWLASQQASRVMHDLLDEDAEYSDEEKDEEDEYSDHGQWRE